MEPPPFAKYVALHPNMNMYSGSSSWQEPEVIDLTPSPGPQGSSRRKRKHAQVDPQDIIEIEEDENPAGIVIAGEKDHMGLKKKAIMGYHKNWQKEIKEALANDLIGFNTHLEYVSNSPWDPLKKFGPGSQDLNYDLMDIDYEISLGAQLDAIDQPPWVENSIPWLQQPAIPEICTSSSGVVSQPSSSRKMEETGDDTAAKFKLFKQFDTVRDYSDHHYIKSHQPTRESFLGGSLAKKTAPGWTKKIQQEWKILEKDLPDSIFVRVYEERMDLLRGVIVGAAGTPYHDGLFFFDILFPPSYPSVPPHAFYHSGGLRLNPNLYACGKVCLSLLNTWTGSGSEKWNPGKSTMLQVLVSIQALVLNAKPFFNEPGYAMMAGTPVGEERSLAYNEETFLLSCKTMLYTLQRPPKHFEEYVVGHFRERAQSILVACKAYMEGAQVGCLVGGGVQDVDEGDKSCSSKFKTQLGQLFPRLVAAFSKNGADCSEFPTQAGKADTTLKL